MVRLSILLLGCLKYDCGGAQSYYRAVLNPGSFPVAQYAVLKECAGQAGEVPQGITDLTGGLFLDGNDAVTSVHAAVVGVNRNGYVVTGIVSANYVLTLLKGKVLAEPEYVLHNGDGAESQVVDLFLAVCVFLSGGQLAGSYAYAELFAAVFALKHK